MDQAPKQYTLPSPPTDAISSLSFSPHSSARLLVSSWDASVHLYSADPLAPTKLTSFPHSAPVLSTCFGETDNSLYSASLDWTVNSLDPETGRVSVLGTHAAGVKSVCYNPTIRSVVSGSWDKSVALFDPRSSTPQTSVHPQPHKIFAMDTVAHILVVAMAERSVFLYDLRNMGQPWQRRESSLKFMTRTVECMPNAEGYASSSIEGRVAVEFFDPSEQSQTRKYAFKCHRQTDGGVDVVYPVNALSFHPSFGTFASGGGDGVVSLWDGLAKRRLRQYQKYPASIAGLSFNREGRYLAIGSSGGFEDGRANGECPPETVQLFVREMSEGECKGKGR